MFYLYIILSFCYFNSVARLSPMSSIKMRYALKQWNVITAKACEYNLMFQQNHNDDLVGFQTLGP